MNHPHTSEGERDVRAPRSQQGFIRSVVWLGLIVAFVALVLLDGLALFNAYKSTEESAGTAAREARNVYAETQDVVSAEIAAKTYLVKADKSLSRFETSRSTEGELVFTVSAQGHAETYGFKYLQYLGLEGWVMRAMEPVASESST